MKCHYCPATEDLRPYGPNGAMVCFDCATATSGPVAVIDGSNVGPYPAKHNPALASAVIQAAAEKKTAKETKE